MVFLTAEDGVKCDAFDSKYVTCIPTLYLGVNVPSPSHPTTHKRNDKNKSTRTNGDIGHAKFHRHLDIWH